jgi:hypothetical protein
VAYELTYWPRADDMLTELEHDPAMAAVLQSVERVLTHLAEDPFNPRLGTTAFVTDELGGVNATPARRDNWYVIWQRGPEGTRTIEIILVHQLHV